MADISSNGTGGGNWSSTSSWSGGVVPGTGDTANLVSGDTITVDQNITIGDDHSVQTYALNIAGILDVPYNIASSYTLTCRGDLDVAAGGEFKIGSSSNRLDSTKTYTIKINDSASIAHEKYDFRVSSTGKLSWYGTAKTMGTTLTAQALSGQANIVCSDVTGWQVGDTLTVVDNSDRTKTEEHTISSIASTTVTLSSNLTNTKESGYFVMQTTANIIVENSDNTNGRGRFFLDSTNSESTVISYASFNWLGNTNWAMDIAQKTFDNTNNNNYLFVNNCHSYADYGSDGNEVEHVNLYKARSNAIDFTSSKNLTYNNIYAVECTNRVFYKSGGDRCYFGDVQIYSVNASFNPIYSINTLGNIYQSMTIHCGNNLRWNYEQASSTPGVCIGTLDCRYANRGLFIQSDLTVNNLVCSDNNGTDIYCDRGGYILAEKATLSSTNKIQADGIVRITEWGGTAGYNRTYNAGTYLESDSSTVRTSGSSLKVTPSRTTKEFLNLSGLARTFYVTSGKSYELQLYSRKSATSTGATAKIRVACGTDAHGLVTTEFDILPSATTTWELKTLNFNPSVAASSSGFVTLELIIEKGSGSWVLNIDDISLTET